VCNILKARRLVGSDISNRYYTDLDLQKGCNIIAGISDSPKSKYVGGIAGFSKNMLTTIYGMTTQY
jgi:hypothetical protein